MEGAQQFAARRRADLATDPKTASKWVPAVAGQEGILHTVSSELVDLFQELDRRLKSKKMGEDDAAKMLPVAVSELIRAFGRAAGASHLAAEANPLLADARRQKALLPLSLIDDQVRDAQVAVAAQGDTDEAGADDNVKSLSKTMTDTADLRLRITRGDTVTAKEASQVHSDSAELATRARVTTLASTVRTLKTEADAAGVSSGTNPDGSWSVQKICDLILHLAKDPAKAHTQHDSANELFGGWLPRLDDAKRVSAEQNEQDPYGRMQAAVAYVNREMDSMAKQLGGLKEFIEWANKQRQYAQLKHLLTSMALQIGLMIVTGEIAGAGLAAVRGIAMAGEIAEDVRGAGLLWKGAEVLAHAGMQTVASGAAGGEISGTAFAENALGMLLTSAAMKPFKSLLKGDEALERSVENELSKMGRLGKAVKTGAAITAEATIDLGAGVIGSGVAHSVTHGTEMGIASRDEWMTQGFALAASAFVHSHSEGMHARLQEAAREFRHAKLPQAAEAIDVLSLEAQRLGARSTTNKHASPEEAGAMLSERHRLLVQEGAIYSQYGGRNGTVAEVNADLNATNAGLIEIPFQLARLSPVVDGLSYEGTGKEIANAFRGAADNNIELTRRQDEKGVWTVVAGDRTLTIKQVDFAANREHSGPESAGAEVGKAAAPREEPSPEKRKPAGKERLGAHSYASGSSLGLAPTPETIRQGTVRMEDHPDFQSKIEELQRRGYRFEYNPDPNEDPHVHVRQVLTREGKTVRFEKTVFGNRGMRFLDLEHELGHVDQLEGLKTPMPNDQVLENGRPYKGPEIPKVNKQRAAIIEYENRLQEFFRLRARRIDPSVLEEHANGVRAARDFYNERMAEEKTAGRKFRDESFPQMKALESRFENEEGWSYTDAHQERTL